MSIFENAEQLQLLQNLLYPKNAHNGNDSDSTDDDEPVMRNNFTPASIGPRTQQSTSEKSTAKKKRNTVATPLMENEKSGQGPERMPKTIEEWQEMQERDDCEILETRKCPEYKMTYRQAVGTEDVFLQMSNRTATTASCEDLILEVLLPEETLSAEKMNLRITSTEIDLATNVYRLKLPLVHPVDVDRCRAQYENDARKLILTLRLKRELDFVNF